MTLGLAVLDAVAGAVGAEVVAERPVGGGCVSPAARIELADGTGLFVKTAPAGAGPGMIAGEVRSLRMLRRAATGTGLLVPEVVAAGPDWLALEWMAAVPPSRDAWVQLGRGLARLHRQTADGEDACGDADARWGGGADNHIGPLPQTNGAAADWAEFWRERRLLPQLELAGASIDAELRRGFERVLDRLETVLAPAEEDGASVLHGDLWSGNVMMTAAGPALIDPASYCGHREVDLAMAALFGGFDAAFEDAYVAERPLAAGAAVRRAVYQLYYLLVHVNLFGASYIGRTRDAVRAALH